MRVFSPPINLILQFVIRYYYLVGQIPIGPGPANATIPFLRKFFTFFKNFDFAFLGGVGGDCDGSTVVFALVLPHIDVADLVRMNLTFLLVLAGSVEIGAVASVFAVEMREKLKVDELLALSVVASG